jgi:myo-inositol-1(or 4)-monophosphatase
MSAGAAAELPSLVELRELAEAAARLGGELARASFGQPQRVTLKRDRSEVSETDLAAERAIIAFLQQRRPNDGVVAEEAMETRGDGGTEAGAHEGDTAARSAPDRRVNRQSPISNRQSPIVNPQSPIPNPQSVSWIIDPIDGTRNYVRGVPLFACSVAAMRGGMPVAGAIYDPIREVLYAADEGTGVLVNGKPVSAEERADSGRNDSQRQLIVAIPSMRHRSGQALVRAVFDRHVVRNLGCTTLHLALVAVGRFDAAISSNSRLWDLAAGWLLVTRAGGLMTRHGGEELFPLDPTAYAGEELPTLAGSPAAHARLLREAAGDRS